MFFSLSLKTFYVANTDLVSSFVFHISFTARRQKYKLY